MSDSTIRVLSTRPLHAALVASAALEGVSIEVVPFIETAAIEDADLFRRLEELGQRRLTAVFTSSTAVEAVGSRVAGAEWSVFCIGGATSQAAVRYFGEDAIFDTAGSARELAERIIETGVSGEVFFFCGDLRREELPSLLTEAGIALQEVVVYRTVATPKPVSEGYAGILFFSPSAVESFFGANEVWDDVVLFAIGQTTGASLQAASPRNPIVISPAPEAGVLIQQVIDHFKI
ncbi:MAG: uroporphyrinogen-III synthase [Bacteroidetes bacterium]|nr:uroporphyrinogen-III synthase [Bacteroidota bacterium]